MFLFSINFFISFLFGSNPSDIKKQNEVKTPFSKRGKEVV